MRSRIGATRGRHGICEIPQIRRWKRVPPLKGHVFGLRAAGTRAARQVNLYDAADCSTDANVPIRKRIRSRQIWKRFIRERPIEGESAFLQHMR